MAVQEQRRNVIRLHVPFVIPDDELDRGLAILERALGSRGSVED